MAATCDYEVGPRDARRNVASTSFATKVSFLPLVRISTDKG
jgi:hypothetical protein